LLLAGCCCQVGDDGAKGRAGVEVGRKPPASQWSSPRTQWRKQVSDEVGSKALILLLLTFYNNILVSQHTKSQKSSPQHTFQFFVNFLRNQLPSFSKALQLFVSVSG